MGFFITLNFCIVWILITFLGIVPVLAILDSKRQDEVIHEMFENRGSQRG